MEIIALLFSHGSLLLLIGVLLVIHFLERRRFVKREQELLGAVLAKDAREYESVLQAIKTSPKDALNQMKVENDLALNAAKLEGEKGIPVT